MDTNTTDPLVCPYCHQPVSPQFYYCPNCGNKLNTAPLSTTPLTQAWIYAFSIILPFICFLAISKWPAVKYYRSKDPKAKTIGIVACVLMLLSTIIMCWLAYVWTTNYIQETVNGINADISAYGS
jgi:hypothetical protein